MWSLPTDLQSLCDGFAHLTIDGIEAHGAFDETVDAQLVVHHPAGALAGRDTREDQHRLAGILLYQFEELPSLLVGQVHLEGHFVLSVVEHLQQAPGPDGENIYYVQEV